MPAATRVQLEQSSLGQIMIAALLFAVVIGLAAAVTVAAQRLSALGLMPATAPGPWRVSSSVPPGRRVPDAPRGARGPRAP